MLKISYNIPIIPMTKNISNKSVHFHIENIAIIQILEIQHQQ